MKKKIIPFQRVATVLAAVLVSFVAAAYFSKTFYCPGKPDFDESMRLSAHSDVLQKGGYQFIYDICKNLYEKNYVANTATDAPYKIPKIIHQIWLGSPFPEKYKHFRETWLQNHPDWEYRLWTEKEIDDFNLTNKDLYDYACNYGEKSDIAKYEIVYRCGGMYVDTDYECYVPFDHLHKAYDFYIGVQPMDTGHVQIGLGLFAARPGHPLLGRTIDAISKKQKISEPIVLRTGPLFFTQLFYHLAPQCEDKVIALPAGFLYPMGYFEKAKDKDIWVRPESLANHHWAGSWLSEDAFVKK